MKNKEIKPMVKSQNKFVRFIVTGVLVVGIALGGMFGFTGCAKNPGTSSTPSDPPSVVTPVDPTPVDPTPVDPTPVDPTPVESITFAEFMESHSEKALDLANTYLYANIVEDKTVLSETWGFHANSKDELDSVSLTYTYSTSETERTIEVANATFANPIDLDKIVDNSYIESETTATITRKTAYTFDAKEAYLQSDVAEAIFAVVGSSNATTKYYSEITSSTTGVRKFVIAEQTANAINVYNVSISGTTDEEIIANLAYDYNYNVQQHATYPLGDKNSTTIVEGSYQPEEFAPENVQEAVKEFQSDLLNAIEDTFLTTAGKKSFGNSFNASKLTDYYWDIGTGDTISEIKFVASYAKYDDSTIYSIEKITLATPINVNELNKDNVATKIANSAKNASYAQDYLFSYNPQEQGTRNELVNAIFEANNMDKECPTGATRYFVDNGSTLDASLNEARKFSVVEITENGVKEFSIRIKIASDDAGLIEKLSSSENYIIENEITISITGEKLSKSSNSSIVMLSDNQYDYDVSYSDDEVIM